ncbi:hypothetical protein FQN54_001284 [Arachnomyces sp. PD_36]|nr:hypothetical protein FQN54_001284 [Arachnomyces sp. PD_36]
MTLPTQQSPGDGGAIDAPTFGTTFPMAMTMATFMTIAFYNVIELHFLLFSTFRKWQGLYFWSVFVAMWGVALNGLAVIMKTFNIADSKGELMFDLVILLLGWYMMVTGQAVVLYSRLHLMIRSARTVRGVLFMIVFTAVTCHLPLSVLVFVVNNVPPGHLATRVYSVYEPLQLTMFSVQEIIISGLYIYHTVKMLRPSQGLRGAQVGKTFLHLIYINAFIIVLDITLASLQYAGYDSLQHFYKPAVYSVKLKLEFSVLNQLFKVTQGEEGGWRNYGGSDRAPKTSRYGHATKDSYESAGVNNIAMDDMKKDRTRKATEVATESASSSEDVERTSSNSRPLSPSPSIEYWARMGC